MKKKIKLYFILISQSLCFSHLPCIFSIDANTAPDCTPDTRLVTIPETTAPASTVLNLACVDVDTGADGTLTCSIISGNDEGAFGLGTSCDLKTVTQPDFDFGTRSYSVTKYIYQSDLTTFNIILAGHSKLAYIFVLLADSSSSRWRYASSD